MRQAVRQPLARALTAGSMESRGQGHAADGVGPQGARAGEQSVGPMAGANRRAVREKLSRSEKSDA